jgi:hypothetical protein
MKCSERLLAHCVVLSYYGTLLVCVKNKFPLHIAQAKRQYNVHSLEIDSNPGHRSSKLCLKNREKKKNLNK